MYTRLRGNGFCGCCRVDREARVSDPVAFSWMRGELGPKRTSVFVLLGLIVWIGLPRIVPNGELFVASALALLDIALLFVVLKGDVRIG